MFLGAPSQNKMFQQAVSKIKVMVIKTTVKNILIS